MALPRHSFSRLGTPPRILAKLVANYMLSRSRKVLCQGAKRSLPANDGVHDIKVRSAEGQVKLAPRGATP
jgi:hypothetical protein